MPRVIRRNRPAPRERKNMRLDQELLDSAKLVLGTTNETEAVTLALRRVVSSGQVAAGLRKLGGSGLVDPTRVHDDSDAE